MSEIKTNKISSLASNNDITIDPDGTGDVVVASGHKLGVSTASPTTTLQVGDGSADTRSTFNPSSAFAIGVKNGSSHGGFIGSNGSSGMQFSSSGGAARMTIDSSGKVGIGTSAPAQLLEISGTEPIIRLTDTGASNNYSEINADYTSGSLQISADTANASSNSRIIFAVDNSERVRIDASGNVLVGSTSFSEDGSTNSIKIHPDEILTGTTSSSANTHLGFSNPNGRVGSIVTNGSSTLFNTSSDHRLKEAVVDMTGAIDRVKTLAPKRFNFIADADTTVDGFLAHEAQAVVPEAVTGTKDEVETWTQQQIDDGDAPDGTSAGDNKLDKDGNTIPVMQGIDQSKLVPLLTAALKESIAKIETLETKVAALEAGE